LASLVVELDTAGRALRLLVRGDVDLVSHEQLREALNIAVSATDQRPIEVDLRGVTFLDAAGVGIMVGGYNAAHRRGLTLRVVGAAGIVRRVLEITGAAGVLVA
jgi:anti-anti-sigma factor